MLPGGVDPHCHIMADVAAATRAAALGGTTTVLSFTNPAPGRGRGRVPAAPPRPNSPPPGPSVDVGLHAMLYRPDHVAPAELRALRDAGAAAIKVFLAYPELGIMWSASGLSGLMTAAARVGLVVQVHCEDGPVIDGLTAAAIAAGRTGAGVFAQTRPPETEAASAALVLRTARRPPGRPATSSTCPARRPWTRSGWRAGAGRARGTLYGEVCLHHLLLDDRRYQRADAERYLVAPPLRPAGHPGALWRALADGTLDTVGSDHCQERSRTIGELAPDGRGYGYGIAGIGARLPCFCHRAWPGACRPGGWPRSPARIRPGRSATTRARAALAPGSDADVLIWDPAAESTITAGTFDDGTGDSVYVGERLRGRVRDVLLRGRVLVRDGRFVAGDALGAYLPSGNASLPSGSTRPGTSAEDTDTA